MGDSLSTHHVRGWLLVGSGCVYAFFYGPQFAGLDFGGSRSTPAGRQFPRSMTELRPALLRTVRS